MHILVTGATGFVGSHAAAELARQGHTVRALVRDATRAERVLGAVGLPADAVDVVVGDVTRNDDVAKALDGCAAVVHAAAVVSLHRRDADEAQRVNTAATEAVLGAGAESGCEAIVAVSSVSVFERITPALHLDGPLRAAAGGYSASKVACERFARGMQAAGAPVRIVYPSGVIGPDAPSPSVVHTAAVTWIRAMPMISSGVNLVDVRDLAAVLAAAATRDGVPNRLMAGGHYTEWADLVDRIEAMRGRHIRRYRAPGPAMRGLGRVLDLTGIRLPIDFELTHETMTEASRAVPVDSSATEASLGITPRPIEETLADTYRWLVAVGALAPGEIGAMGNVDRDGGRTGTAS
ncbi:MAG: NAD-dependent epimerase/dehydratase family protein [Microthrixaceae bacterium]